MSKIGGSDASWVRPIAAYSSKKRVWYSQIHGKVMLSAQFESGRIDPTNPIRAIFTETECAPEFRAKLASRLRSQLKCGNVAQDPAIIMQLRHDWINDTAVPGLEIDYDGLTLSCDWRGLYSALFREERELERRNKRWFKEQESGAFAAMKARVNSDRADPMEMMKRTLMMHGNSWTNQRRSLRRERISKEVLEKDGVEWIWHADEDQEALNYLKEYRT
ncbi:hypothetical protein H0H81_002372 [Sphagnurus paluster]|uniref:Uncharacterized protein n=1 Tax=Sphagnurus paluster TaxID=117069 RepID=A0A9P7GGR2_9AGAR|nr:hypothetical protein H0H81_002372 [Sphagnurus paluster]